MAQLIELLNEKYKATQVSTSSVNAPQRGKKIRICYFCRKHGHFINNCPERMEAKKAVSCPINNVSRMEQRRMHKCRYKNLNWRDRDYLKESYRYNYEIGNWRRIPYKDEPENWREDALKPNKNKRMSDDANWRQLPVQDQNGRMYKDANWREVPVLDSDQFGRSFKDVRCDVMDL
jgi:hypothetical protein